MVAKRSGERQPFDRSKIVTGLRLAAKGRPIDADALDQLATEAEDSCVSRAAR